jgi:hypothetical protein
VTNNRLAGNNRNKKKNQSEQLCVHHAEMDNIPSSARLTDTEINDLSTELWSSYFPSVDPMVINNHLPNIKNLLIHFLSTNAGKSTVSKSTQAQWGNFSHSDLFHFNARSVAQSIPYYKDGRLVAFEEYLHVFPSEGMSEGWRNWIGWD